MEKTVQRKVYLDVLRILSTLAVVLIHVSTLHYYDFSPRSLGWFSINLYDAVARWSVPVFVMISGALFLDRSRTVDVRQIFGKNILRLLTAFAFWSLLYAVYYAVICGEGWQAFCQRLLGGNFHMWFVMMIAGMYVLVPVLRKITESPPIAEYCLAFSFLSVFLIPELLHIPALSMLKSSLNNLLMPLSVGYGAYFIGGWYLSRKDWSRKQRVCLYWLGVAGLLNTILCTSLISYKTGRATADPFFNYFSAEVMLEAVALFTLARYVLANRSLRPETLRWISKCSQYSFGAYMAHILVLEFVQKCGLRVTSFPAIASVPVMTVIVFGVSMAISALIHKIPVLRKYVV